MNPTVTVVTGGNRGLGLQVCRDLGRRGHRVVLTGRSLVQAEDAARSLRDEGLDVVAAPLDVSDETSVLAFSTWLRQHEGRCDVLVHNAGVALEQSAEESVFAVRLETVRRTLETNCYGPLRVTQALVDLLRASPHGRIVHVSSGMGQLTDMDGGSPAYRMSKTALNALTRILAAELQGTRVKVNAICPGWVRTDMGGPEAPRSVEQGAAGIVWAATLPDDGPTGGYFRDGEPIPW